MHLYCSQKLGRTDEEYIDKIMTFKSNSYVMIHIF